MSAVLMCTTLASSALMGIERHIGDRQTAEN